MKRVVDRLYGMKGYPNQARFDNFKTDLFEYDVPVPILVDTINEGTADAGVTVEGVLLKDGTVTTTAPTIKSLAAAVTAHAGGTKAAAFALTEEINIVTICATAGDSVLLPAAIAGQEIKVVNLGVANLYVYGAGTNTIDDIATANPFIMQVEDVVVFSAYTTGKWQSDSEAEGIYTTLYVDTIAENSSGTGITADGVLHKDGGVTLAPTGNTSPIIITGTNVTTGHIIDFNAPALTTGSIFDIAAITTKVSGYLYNGSMTTSTLTDSTLLDDFACSCASDGLAADTLRMIRRTWSGTCPNGTAAVDLILAEFIWSGTYGSAATKGGSPTIMTLSTTATINDSSANFYGLNVDLSGMTLTSCNNVYGIKVATKTGVDAAVYCSDNAAAHQVWITDNLSGVDARVGTVISRIAIGTTAFDVSGTTVTGLALGGTITNAIDVTAAATVTNFIKFDAIAGCVLGVDVNPKDVPSGGGLGADACIRVLIGAADYFIPLFAIELS